MRFESVEKVSIGLESVKRNLKKNQKINKKDLRYSVEIFGKML